MFAFLLSKEKLCNSLIFTHNLYVPSMTQGWGTLKYPRCAIHVLTCKTSRTMDKSDRDVEIIIVKTSFCPTFLHILHLCERVHSLSLTFFDESKYSGLLDFLRNNFLTRCIGEISCTCTNEQELGSRNKENMGMYKLIFYFTLLYFLNRTWQKRQDWSC